MDNINERQTARSQIKYESLMNNEDLLRKIIRVAQFESEIDLGVNPLSLSQAKTGNLSEQDFEYISRVCLLVEKRLKDPNWIESTLDLIKNKPTISNDTIRGVRFDDELFKAGRGILEAYYS